MNGRAQATRPCAVCGRSISWRRKWARCWEEVRYCSERCRALRARASADDEAAILTLLAARANDATICPSEILPADERRDRARTERVREAARRLVHAGRIEILQRGAAVSPDAFRGPIRLRLKR